jgi:UDP-N-acetylglucosamine 3-dehydrogenase
MPFDLGSESDGGHEVRVGLIGCGDIATRVHLPGLRAAGAHVTRFASADLADAEAAAAASGESDAMATSDWRQVVASVHIDAVDICTPSHLHAEMALAAIDAGKHVLIESPMALSAADADAVLKAAARKGVVVVPAHSVRFIGPYAAVAAAARSGVIGRITGAALAFGHGGPDALNPGAAWYFDRAKSGGGALIDLGLGQIDLLRDALGAEVVEVSAVTYGRRGEVEERAEARLSFDSGATAQIRAGWSGMENHVEIAGTDGALKLDATTPPHIVRPDGSIERLPASTSPSSIEAVFVDAVARGIAPPVSAADGRAAVAIVGAAYESVAAGRSVEVPRPKW